MTLYGFLASVVWAVVVFDAVRRADVLFRLNAAPRDVRIRPASDATPPRLSNIVVPDDLVAVAMLESEPWAVDDQLSLMREKYLEYGDWQKVRRAIGIGEMPELP